MIALAVVWLMTWLVGVGWLIVAWPETTVPPCGAASAALAKPRQIATLSGWNGNERRWRSAVGAILVGRFFIRRSLGLLVRRQRGPGAGRSARRALRTSCWRGNRCA